MTSLSIGLLYPLANWLIARYFVSRKYIDGRRLKYTGKLWLCFIIIYIGLALLFVSLYFIQAGLKYYNLTNSIPHQLLNVIPGTLVTLFIKIGINKYNQVCTHFVDEEGKESGFEIHVWLLLGKYILTKIIEVVSLWILYPLSTRLSTLYDYRRGYIDGYHFIYPFSMKQMYPRHLLDLLLAVVTFGFYFPLIVIKRMTIDQTFVHIDEEYKQVKKK